MIARTYAVCEPRPAREGRVRPLLHHALPALRAGAADDVAMGRGRARCRAADRGRGAVVRRTRPRARCSTPTAAATRATPPRCGAASRLPISPARRDTVDPAATHTPSGPSTSAREALRAALNADSAHRRRREAGRHRDRRPRRRRPRRADHPPRHADVRRSRRSVPRGRHARGSASKTLREHALLREEVARADSRSQEKASATASACARPARSRGCAAESRRRTCSRTISRARR